ncbi:MAG: aspartate racemase [Thermoplasmata archaeon]|nr:MAG: aspartate racemase [Thermoplasmata archaeon]
MKTIGLIGGTTWVSTLEYYRIINETVNNNLGGHHSARCILYSIDFEESVLKHKDNWDEISNEYIDIAKTLERSGADLLIICANTMHKVADEVQNNINIPLIHIVDAIGERIRDKGLKKVGLLGSKYTMKEDFYKKKLKEEYNIKTVVPDDLEMELIHNVIFDELAINIKNSSSKMRYIEIINNLVLQGAEGIILGCTEIPLLIKPQDVNIEIFDSTMIHAQTSVKYALE